MAAYPQGFVFGGFSTGMKADAQKDFAIALAHAPSPFVAALTTNSLCGAPVLVARKLAKKGWLQALAVHSGYANVGLGQQGIDDVYQIQKSVGEALLIESEMVLVSATGVIGKRVPVHKIESFLKKTDIRSKLHPDGYPDFAEAIRTTDTVSKIASRSYKDCRLLGIAKGAGMIEPKLHLATMLAFFFTDLDIPYSLMKRYFAKAIDLSFQSITVDSDTSTSDMVVLVTSRKVPPTDDRLDWFSRALSQCALDLAKMIVKDGEGASKFFEVEVKGAVDAKQAKRIAKQILNSPLVKTAFAAPEPNIGRLYMAIGKGGDPHLDWDRILISFYHPETGLPMAKDDLYKENEIGIGIDLGLGEGKAKAYGCDLTREYVEINTEYLT